MSDGFIMSYDVLSWVSLCEKWPSFLHRLFHYHFHAHVRARARARARAQRSGNRNRKNKTPIWHRLRLRALVVAGSSLSTSTIGFSIIQRRN